MKVSVIMASFLAPYPGAASNRDKKFIRAVNSFKKQTYTDTELLIVSDGCEITNRLYLENFSNDSNIHLLPIPKQPLYGALTRDIALQKATGDICLYLDSDDVIGKTHIQTIVEQFTDDVDWVYYNDLMVLNKEFNKFFTRIVEPRYGSIGTSSIAHRNFYSEKYKELNQKPRWKNGYGHDWLYILDITSKGMQFKKLEKMPQYIVCHYANGDF
jgi:glycosyltransferase involved in cell wall biosynthesis